MKSDKEEITNTKAKRLKATSIFSIDVTRPPNAMDWKCSICEFLTASGGFQGQNLRKRKERICRGNRMEVLNNGIVVLRIFNEKGRRNAALGLTQRRVNAGRRQLSVKGSSWESSALASSSSLACNPGLSLRACSSADST